MLGKGAGEDSGGTSVAHGRSQGVKWLHQYHPPIMNHGATKPLTHAGVEAAFGADEGGAGFQGGRAVIVTVAAQKLD